MGIVVFGALKGFILSGGTTLKTSCLWGVPLNLLCPQGRREFTAIGNYTSLIWRHKSWEMGISFHSRSLQKKRKKRIQERQALKELSSNPLNAAPRPSPSLRFPLEGAGDDKNMD